MDIYFSTVVRTAPVKQGGELIKLDWDTKTIKARVPIYPENPELDDPNPRGNTRGGRGVALLHNTVMVGSYHTLQFYDPDLNPLHQITHPLMVNLHECFVSPHGTVFVACTSIDAILEVDLLKDQVVRAIWPREHPGIQQGLDVEPLAIDKQADNRALFLSRAYMDDPSHLHINAIAPCNGHTLALCNAYGAVVNVDTGEVVINDPTVKGAHNLIVENGTILISDTKGHAVRFYDRQTGELKRKIDLEEYPEVQHITGIKPKSEGLLNRVTEVERKLQRKVSYKLGIQKLVPAAPLFVRGLDVVGDDLFVGFSPATILQINRNTGALIDCYQFSDDVHVCVHGLKVVH